MFAAGCVVRSHSADETVRLADWMPGGAPYKRANLILSGTVVPVQVAMQKKAGTTKFSLSAHGVVLEEEAYQEDEGGFRLVGAGGERYDPPITLIPQPHRAGEQSKWVGQIVIGLLAIDAKATMSSARETLNAPGGPYDALRVDVRLYLDGGEPQPVTRDLRFWFAKGKGIVKREFGSGSTREPASD